MIIKIEQFTGHGGVRSLWGRDPMGRLTAVKCTPAEIAALGKPTFPFYVEEINSEIRLSSQAAFDALTQAGRNNNAAAEHFESLFG